MKLTKLLTIAFASALLFTTSCTDDSNATNDMYYGNGFLVANEGSYGKPNAEVTFVSSDLNTKQDNIFSSNNGSSNLGDVLQTIAFNGENAYLVLNNSNKIEVVNRYNFKRITTVTSNLQNPRYMAFSGNQYYVTNNNYTDVRKLNVYNNDNSYVKSISFDRAAEKVVEASGSIVVQTDGVTYDASFNELPTGYTITIIKPSTNTVDKTVTLPSNGIIRDLISYNGNAYALASDNTNSYIYKIDAAAGTFTITTLTALPQAQRLIAYNNKFYFYNSSNKIYSMTVGSTTIPTTPLVTATGYLYGFNIIDDKLFVSDASFTADSKVNVYNTTSGALLKTFTAGIGTNGFFKN